MLPSQFDMMNNLCIWLTDSASLGGALRAAHGWLCSQKGSFVPIADLYEGKLEKSALSCKLSVKAGDQELVSKYALLMKKRMEIENRLVKDLGRCWCRETTLICNSSPFLYIFNLEMQHLSSQWECLIRIFILFFFFASYQSSFTLTQYEESFLQNCPG